MTLLTVIDLTLAGVLLFVQFPQNNDTLSNLLREKPDLGLLCTLLLALTLGWGAMRTLLFIHTNRKVNA
jgi:hypothetical protein